MLLNSCVICQILAEICPLALYLCVELASKRSEKESKRISQSIIEVSLGSDRVSRA